jgi:hypothetical protein
VNQNQSIERVAQPAIVLRAALELAGWPRAVQAPHLTMTAWCAACGKTHHTPWRMGYHSDRVVQIRRCRAAGAVYLQLDVEARAEVPKLLKRLAACQTSWREWRASSRGMKARPRTVDRSQFRTYGDHLVRDTRVSRDETG